MRFLMFFFFTKLFLFIELICCVIDTLLWNYYSRCTWNVKYGNSCLYLSVLHSVCYSLAIVIIEIGFSLLTWWRQQYRRFRTHSSQSCTVSNTTHIITYIGGQFCIQIVSSARRSLSSIKPKSFAVKWSVQQNLSGILQNIIWKLSLTL